ncbi:MAG: hypothetical protein U9P44_04070 [archaeon]|nr:hypothetical protein [archaeon]
MRENAIIRYFENSFYLQKTDAEIYHSGLQINGISLYRPPSLAHAAKVLEDEAHTMLQAHTTKIPLLSMDLEEYTDKNFLEEARSISDTIITLNETIDSKFETHTEAAGKDAENIFRKCYYEALGIEKQKYILMRATAYQEKDKDYKTAKEEASVQTKRFFKHVRKMPEVIDLTSEIKIRTNPVNFDSKKPLETAYIILNTGFSFPLLDYEPHPMLENEFSSDNIEYLKLTFPASTVEFTQRRDDKYRLRITTGSDFKIGDIDSIIENLFFR